MATQPVLPVTIPKRFHQSEWTAHISLTLVLFQKRSQPVNEIKGHNKQLQCMQLQNMTCLLYILFIYLVCLFILKV